MAQHRYKVTTYTPHGVDAGTDTRVSMGLKGPQGQFETMLYNGDRNQFQQGHHDEFVITGPDVGSLQWVGFRLINPDPDDENVNWHCQECFVQDLDSGFTVRFNDWGWVRREHPEMEWKRPN
jgi:hypothetical protein